MNVYEVDFGIRENDILYYRNMYSFDTKTLLLNHSAILGTGGES